MIQTACRRLLPIIVLSTSVAAAQVPAAGQTTKPAPQPPPVQVPVAPALESDAQEVRQQLREVMQRYPPDLGRILKMDPTLLQDPNYLSRYPALTSFLGANPQVAHNPAYFFDYVRVNYEDYVRPTDPQSRAIEMWRNTMEALSVFVVMVFFGSIFVWLIRTALDHRRWLRLTKTQTEVHNKLLDRFAGSNELMSYVQTPAGRRFLEAAPIPLDSPGIKGSTSPLGRILWSIQAGIVVAIGGIGFQFVSGRVIPEVAEGLWMIGVLGLAFGIGFILSGVVSYILSRRFGLLEPAPPLPVSGRGDSAVV